LNLIKILSVFLFGLGIMGIVWFVRTFLRKSTIGPIAENPLFRWIICIVCVAFLLGGWSLYSSFGKIPIGGVALGAILGIRVLINEHTGRWF
jgi:hypothetical protein